MSDTIVARSTAPGPAAIAVVRLSGPDAVQITRRLCPDLPPSLEARRAHLVRLIDPDSGELLDRGLVTLFRAPASYTGEDVVEVSCHGGWLSPDLVEEAAVQLGCRRAEPGEFTRRAYLNGKLDLIQAEAVMDLVEGRNRALRRAALGQLERGLSRRVSELRAALVHTEALLAHHIDFPEEDQAPVGVEAVALSADETVRRLDELLRTAPEGELLREGAITVLAGRPNVGKSSLFNALLGSERAIVTDVPGTTRDAIEGVVSMGGYPFRLVDTAGIRETAEPVEKIGVEVARRALERADLLLLCAEAGRPLDREELEVLSEVADVPVVLVRTKADRAEMGANGPDPDDRAAARSGPPPGAAAELEVSVVTGWGLGELRQLLPTLVYRGLVEAAPEAPVLTRRRHAAGLRRAAEEVRQFARALRAGVPAEVAATHLRPAESALEEVLGVVSVDDVLDVVFREFCIGK